MCFKNKETLQDYAALRDCIRTDIPLDWLPHKEDTHHPLLFDGPVILVENVAELGECCLRGHVQTSHDADISQRLHGKGLGLLGFCIPPTAKVL